MSTDHSDQRWNFPTVTELQTDRKWEPTVSGATMFGVSSPESEKEATDRRHRHAVYASETIGLVVIAVLLLVLTLVRYWQSIHGSLR